MQHWLQDGKDDKDDLVQLELTLEMDPPAPGDKIALETDVGQDVAAALGSDLMHVRVLGLRADSGVVVVTVRFAQGVCVCIDRHQYIDVCRYRYRCMHICMYTYVYRCMCVCVCVCMYIYIYTHTHTHT